MTRAQVKDRRKKLLALIERLAQPYTYGTNEELASLMGVKAHTIASDLRALRKEGRIDCKNKSTGGPDWYRQRRMWIVGPDGAVPPAEAQTLLLKCGCTITPEYRGHADACRYAGFGVPRYDF